MFGAMQAVTIEGKFGLENLRLSERPTAALALGQVRLRMRAASLNYRDLLMAQGMYNPRQPLPLVLGSDGVGEVVEIGPDVSRVKVGDRACPIFAQEWIAGSPTKAILRSTLGGPRDGTLTQEMVISGQALVRVPDALSDDAAATLPCAAVTAWSALVTQGRLCAGQTVLTQGTGGVSIFALQIAKMLGARVIVTSKSDEKLERARNLGADHTINYAATPEWGRCAKELAGGDGVDHVIEVGGGGTLGQSLRAVRPGGTISVIGVLSGISSEVSLLPLLMQNVRMQGVVVGHRDSFEALLSAAVHCKLSPVIDRTFALAETKQALEYLATAAHLGKIVVRMPEA
jgi:NADPH:quinone reductase-like Zn-dependent oxidoreductase